MEIQLLMYLNAYIMYLYASKQSGLKHWKGPMIWYVIYKFYNFSDASLIVCNKNTPNQILSGIYYWFFCVKW